MKQAYLFILGRQLELSLAESIGYFNGRNIDMEVKEIDGSVVIIEAPLLNPKLLIGHLAGIVKIAEVVSQIARPENLDKWQEQLQPILAHDLEKAKSLTFGLSFYGETKFLLSAKEQEQLALSLKRWLKNNAKHLRWVNGHGKPLTSVQVSKNKLDTEQGAELIIYFSEGKVIIGKTLAVQEFEDWSERDYGRPRRDAKRGMLPPKLARIMINMLGLPPVGILLDPFCGSGTVLSEASLLGWPKLIGADKSTVAAKDAKANIEWLNKHGIARRHPTEIKFLTCSIKDLPRRLAPNSIEAIVTEPYLGEPLTSPANEKIILKIQSNLIPLYNDMLLAIGKLLKINGRAVFILPCWMTHDGKEKSFPLSNLLWPKSLLQINPLNALPKHQSTPLIYRRPNQFVAREIITVEKVAR